MHTLTNHGFQTDDFVKLSELVGLESANQKTFKVKAIIDTKKFVLTIDKEDEIIIEQLRNGEYERNGIVKMVKMPVKY